ncbi:MAG TPA: hypothetical protein PKE62_07560 [Anaerolineales bacterium]|nr:hypothetical protein [Anaerolineales bacterium]
MSIITAQPRVILERTQVNDVWEWLVSNISDRSVQTPGQCFVDDRKLWGVNIPQPLSSTDEFLINVAKLYLVSQLGDLSEILGLSKGKGAFELLLVTKNLDQDIRVVIASGRRFRDALSEHLGFWVTLGTITKLHLYEIYAISQPNFQPEDKGPDGLFYGLDANGNPNIEIRSIKNSTRNPRYLIATGEFRKGGAAHKNKQLEEYYLLVEEEYGFARLDRLLSQVSSHLKVAPNVLTRSALLKNASSYNAIVVANDMFHAPKLFDGFDRVFAAPENRIATYIGADRWAQFAENTRSKVIEILTVCGVW